MFSFSLLLEVLKAQLLAIKIFRDLDSTPEITDLARFEFLGSQLKCFRFL
jgi:hypothetical protein